MITGTGKYGGNVAVEFTIGQAAGGPGSSIAGGKAGTEFTYKNVDYKILTNGKGTGSGTTALIRANNKKSFTVPETVKYNGKTFKVVQIKAGAFTGKNIRTVTVGANVKKIAANAFKGSKVTRLILKTRLLKKSAVRKSLKGSRISTIKVNISKKQNSIYVKKYKKIFTKANAGKKVTVK